MLKKTLLAGALLLLTSASAFGQAAAWMRTDGRTTQPIGHYEFCQAYPAECEEITKDSSPIRLTHDIWATLIDVDTYVNSVIEPQTDQEIWGKPEVWSYPKRTGDCEDYVLMKRRMLMNKGLPAGALLITVVRQRNGDGHAVLTVRTDRGDFILDNLDPRVRLWTDTDYHYLKRQSERYSGTWVSISDERSTLVGSINR